MTYLVAVPWSVLFLDEPAKYEWRVLVDLTWFWDRRIITLNKTKRETGNLSVLSIEYFVCESHLLTVTQITFGNCNCKRKRGLWRSTRTWWVAEGLHTSKCDPVGSSITLASRQTRSGANFK